MQNGVSTVTLDQLIEAALTGQTRHHERLGKEARRYAMAIARARAPDLPPDLHEDIFQQAFIELLQFGPEALTGAGGKTLFRRAVLNAVRVVRASYAPPGVRTRHQKAPAAALTAVDVARTKIDGHRVRRAGDTGSGAPPTNIEQVPDPRQQAAFLQIDNVIYVERLLTWASAPVARALRMIHFDDAGVEVAANDLRMSRFTLNRRLKDFYATVRAAA